MNKASNDDPEPQKETIHTGKLKQDPTESYLPLSSSQPQRHKRILVVDDNSDIVLTLRVGLEMDSTIQVFGYDNPVTALVEFTPNFYDLLLIDVKPSNLKICYMWHAEAITGLIFGFEYPLFSLSSLSY